MTAVQFDNSSETVVNPAARCARCGSTSSLTVLGDVFVCRSYAEGRGCWPDRLTARERARAARQFRMRR